MKNNYYGIIQFDKLIKLREQSIREYLDFFFQKKILKKEVMEPSIYGNNVELLINEMEEERVVHILRFIVKANFLTQLNNDFRELINSKKHTNCLKKRKEEFDNIYTISINKENCLNDELQKQEKNLKMYVSMFPDINYDDFFQRGVLNQMVLNEFLNKRKKSLNIFIDSSHIEEYISGKYDKQTVILRMYFFSRLYSLIQSLDYFYFLKTLLNTNEKEENVPEGYDPNIFNSVPAYNLFLNFLTNGIYDSKVKQVDWIYIYNKMKKEKLIHPYVSNNIYADWSSNHPFLEYNFEIFRFRKNRYSNTKERLSRYKEVKHELGIK